MSGTVPPTAATTPENAVPRAKLKRLPLHEQLIKHLQHPQVRADLDRLGGFGRVVAEIKDGEVYRLWASKSILTTKLEGD